ncbi:amidohydrolase family protein [Hymenobacter psychrophilus]|uniref:Imidazolonepropionase n=1 Tax=Hymenobacter psychrophilus TaxID=651662 RepID=A0A1H3CYE0_9BACT|nr:amidohydrolase family protein [Hymenobacter psychrophilus]SDX58918.1 Imidazolonepropionase [Hymenobacter psychrophilus]
MRNPARLLLSAALLLAAGCTTPPATTPYDLVITHANVVDVETGTIRPDQMVAVAGGVIRQLGATTASTPRAARTLDAQGRYLMPGLWDMHVHFRGGDSLITANRNLLPLYLAHGITTVRDAGGDLTPAVMEWRRQITAGRLAGPTIFTSGPKIDGHGAFWAGSLEVETPAQIARALDSLQALKVDYVKIYESTISRVAFLGTVAQAEKRGMRTTGHMPYTVTLAEAAAAGLDASEHLYYVFKACSNREDSLTAVIRQSQGTAKPIGLFAALPAVYRTYDPATAARTFRMLAERRTAVVPTLYIQQLLADLPTTDHSRDSLLAYIDPALEATYARRLAGARQQSAATRAFNQQLGARFRSLIPGLQKAGVLLLAGSDSGASNSYVYPGAALLGELDQLVRAGLTPAEALRTATINGAIFFHQETTAGSIDAGKAADLLLLEQNPLTSLAALRGIHTVVARGRVYSAAELRQQLQAVRRR